MTKVERQVKPQVGLTYKTASMPIALSRSKGKRCPFILRQAQDERTGGGVTSSPK